MMNIVGITELDNPLYFRTWLSTATPSKPAMVKLCGRSALEIEDHSEEVTAGDYPPLTASCRRTTDGKASPESPV